MKPEALGVKHQIYVSVFRENACIDMCVCGSIYIIYIGIMHWYTVEANMIFVKKVHKC